MWTAYITNATSRYFKNATSSLVRDDYAYHGLVWCPVVKNQTWIARRGGRPFITGNTFPTGLIEPLIKATCPARCCPECGAGWSPVVKRKVPIIGQDIPEAERKSGVQGQASTMSATSALRVSNSANWNQWKADNPDNILGYRPTCGCRAGLLPDDLEVISSPTGKRTMQDPSLVTGRAGFNRPRGPNEGSRPITRYEQRRYAEQLKNSPHRREMESEAGNAFAHYIRTDKSGARPAPETLLESWIERGWIERVDLPELDPEPPHVPGVCLDLFFGSGTVGLVCDRLGLDCIGIDISEKYAVELAVPRIREDAPLLARVAVEGG